jgi:hypothetical protein
MITGQIKQIGEVQDGPVPVLGPASTKSLIVEVGTIDTPNQWTLELSQDAAVELVAKLQAHLKARGCT